MTVDGSWIAISPSSAASGAASTKTMAASAAGFITGGPSARERLRRERAAVDNLVEDLVRVRRAGARLFGREVVVLGGDHRERLDRPLDLVERRPDARGR